MTNPACKFVLSILLVLGLPGAGLVMAQDASAQAVIELGNESVTRSEFDKLFNVAVRMLAVQQGIHFADTTPEQISMLRKQFLGQRANEMALVQEANRRNISVNEEDIQSQFDDYMGKFQSDSGIGKVDEGVLRQLLKEKQQVSLLTELLLKEIEVRPGDVVVLHHDVEDKLATPEQICLRHIVVPDIDTANHLLVELKNGADFADLAKRHSMDANTAAKGGDVGCFAKEHMIPQSDFERAAYNSRVDELAGPVQSELGQHLLIVYERKPARIPTLNEVYNELEMEIRHERLPNLLMEIRDKSGVVTHPERLDG